MKYWTRAWSLVEGCSYVSPGCQNCWSAEFTHRKAGQTNAKIRARYEGLTDINGHWIGYVRLMYPDMRKPYGWRQPQVVAIWNDLLHEDVPLYFIRQAVVVMEETPRHTYLLFTKRPDRLVEFCDFYRLALPPNVWLIISAENQEWLERRMAVARENRGRLVVNLEPLLGPVDLSAWVKDLSGVLCGGESGRRARVMQAEWAWDLRDQCVAAGIPFFFKQWGEYYPTSEYRDGKRFMARRMGRKIGRALDGETWDELPWKDPG